MMYVVVGVVCTLIAYAVGYCHGVNVAQEEVGER